MTGAKYFGDIDVGSTTVKLVVMDQDNHRFLVTNDIILTLKQPLKKSSAKQSLN